MPISLKPSRIDRYIVAEFIGPFLGGIFFFVFIFLMFQLLRLAEEFILHGTPAITLLKIISLMTLSFLPMALPVAFLIAVLVSFGRLSTDSELVAMKASGMGALRLSAPLACIAFAIVALSLFLNLQWVPWGQRTLKSLVTKVGNTKVVSSIKEGTFTSGFFDLLLFADRVDPKTHQLKHVFIYDERNPKSPQTVVAQSGEILQVKTGSELGTAAVLELYDGSIHQSDSQEGTYQKANFSVYRLFLKVDEGASTLVLKPEMIPYRELVQHIKETSPKDYFGAEYRNEYWRRIAIAIAPIFFVFLGIGFGTVRTRAVRAGAALVAFVVLLIYWAAQAAGTIAVQRGSLPPLVAMQLPNAIVSIIAVYSFRRAMW